MTEIPPLHPAAFVPDGFRHLDKFCPDCGRPGEKIRDLVPPFEEWGCRHCEPEAFEEPDS